jgi:hypothetical protein
MSTVQVELPEQVHKRALELASRQSMSLDHLVVVALVEKLSTVFSGDVLEDRAKRGSREGFEEFLRDVPDVEPEPYDRLSN